MRAPAAPCSAGVSVSPAAGRLVTMRSSITSSWVRSLGVYLASAIVALTSAPSSALVLAHPQPSAVHATGPETRIGGLSTRAAARYRLIEPASQRLHCGICAPAVGLASGDSIYANANPLSFTDPTGLLSWRDLKEGWQETLDDWGQQPSLAPSPIAPWAPPQFQWAPGQSQGMTAAEQTFHPQEQGPLATYVSEYEQARINAQNREYTAMEFESRVLLLGVGAAAVAAQL